MVTSELLREGRDSCARTEHSPDGSRACCTTRLVFAKRFARKRIELARPNVGLELLVPGLGIVPRRKLRNTIIGTMPAAIPNAVPTMP